MKGGKVNYSGREVVERVATAPERNNAKLSWWGCAIPALFFIAMSQACIWFFVFIGFLF